MTEPIRYDRLRDAIARAWDHQHQWVARGDEDSLCLVDLLERFERLEQANSKPTPNSSQIRSSLLTVVSEAVCAMADCGDTPSNWRPEARAAVYAVAEWLDGQAGGTRAAWMIRQGLDQ